MNNKSLIPPESVVHILNAGLSMEYGTIIHFPRIMRLQQNKDISQKLDWILSDSMTHASIISSHIKRLGGEPDWAFQTFPENKTDIEFLKIQSDMELKMVSLYESVLTMADTENFHRDLEIIIAAEHNHWDALSEVIRMMESEQC